MSQLLDEEKPPRHAAPRRRSLLRDPESRSVEIGIIATILIHLILLWLAPRMLRIEPVKPGATHPLARSRQFNIQIVTPPAEAQKPRPKFVEVNPNAPENKPDHTNNVGAQNQQAAQPVPSKESSLELPSVKGQTKIHSESIVTGQLKKPVLHEAPPPRPAQPKQTAPQAPRKEEIPLPGYEKQEGTDANGFGANISPTIDNAQPVPDKVAGAKDAQNPNGATQQSLDQTPPVPLPRPQLHLQARPSILEDRPQGVSQAGQIGVNANFGDYGAYLQRVIDTVSAQWDQIIDQSAVYPKSLTHVLVTFYLKSDGTVEILKVDSDSDKLGKLSAVSAITIPGQAPGFGVWPKDMKAMLGDQQEVQFNFYYY